MLETCWFAGGTRPRSRHEYTKELLDAIPGPIEETA